MGIAYTNQPTQYAVIPASPPLTFLASLHTLLLAAGWEYLAPWENGYEYLLTSPQELEVQCRIWYPTPADAGFTNHFAIQFRSHADLAKIGHVHHFEAGHAVFLDWGFTDIVVWANQCQIFLGALHPNPEVDVFARAAAGGIPYVYSATAPTCPDPGPAGEITTEMWWSAGDEWTGIDQANRMNGPVSYGPAPNFRNSYLAMRYSFCRNGTVTNRVINEQVDPVVESTALQLGILRSAYYWNALGVSVWPDGFVRLDETPLANYPMLFEGRTVHGQLWDACLVSHAMELEAEEEIFETDAQLRTNWVSYSKSRGLMLGPYNLRNEGSCYSLLLLLSSATEEIPILNVAY